MLSLNVFGSTFWSGSTDGKLAGYSWIEEQDKWVLSHTQLSDAHDIKAIDGTGEWLVGCFQAITGSSGSVVYARLVESRVFF